MVDVCPISDEDSQWSVYMRVHVMRGIKVVNTAHQMSTPLKSVSPLGRIGVRPG